MTFTGLDARTALITFYGAHAAQFPQLAEVVSKTDLLGSIIEGMELLYSLRADLPEDGIALLDGLARFVSANNFYGKGMRAGLISGVAARIASGGDAEAEGDPVVDAAFMPAPTVPTMLPAGGVGEA